MCKNIVKNFWNCGDSEIVELAKNRANLNKVEREVLHLVLDECMTQEQASEQMYMSVRHFQEIWKSANDKLIKIPWVVILANYN